MIGNEAERFSFLRNSEKLSENEKEISVTGFLKWWQIYYEWKRINIQSADFVPAFIQALWAKTVILIDEYDVPLDKAFQNGYYQEMVSLLRGFSGRL